MVDCDRYPGTIRISVVTVRAFGRFDPVSREVEDRIAAVAARQHGVVTRQQLFEAGLAPGAAGRRLVAGWLQPIHRGVYRIGPLVAPRALEMAALLANGPGAVLSHQTAASVLGFSAMGAAEPDARSSGRVSNPVQVTVAGAGRCRRPGIRVHRVRRLEPEERTVRDGLAVTAPDRTLLDIAASSGSRELEGCVARAMREGAVDRESLVALADRHRGRAGAPALSELLRRGTEPALTRSEAEARLLALIREAGLPDPESNVSIGRYEVDFLWRNAGIAVEVDGFRHHSSRPRFEGDRRKDAWLLAAGIRVLRLSWNQITREAIATAVQVGQALTRAGGGGPTL